MIVLLMLLSVIAGDGQRYRDWMPENPTAYLGTYHYFKFKGSQVVSVEKVTISMNGSNVSLGFANRKGKTFKYSATLNDNIIRTDGGEVHGRFVLRYPPDNAKGDVMKGLLVKGNFFVRSSD